MTRAGHADWRVTVDMTKWTCTVGHMNNPSTAQVAEAVTREMEAAGVSQNGLAEATNIPRSTLIRRLNGASSFKVEELNAIASHLGVPMTALLGVDAA